MKLERLTPIDYHQCVCYWMWFIHKHHSALHSFKLYLSLVVYLPYRRSSNNLQIELYVDDNNNNRGEIECAYQWQSYSMWRHWISNIYFVLHMSSLVSILIIPWEFLKGSFRILNLQDPFKLNSGSWSESFYFPSYKIVSDLVEDPVSYPYIFLVTGCFRLKQDPVQDFPRFLFRLFHRLKDQDLVGILPWYYSGS